MLNFILVAVLTQECLLVTILSAFFTIGVEEIDLIKVIVLALFSELTVHTGLVVWKAKSENARKFPDNSKKLEQVQTIVEGVE